MDELIVPEADHHIGFSGHTGMDGMLAQKPAINAITGVGRLTADDVAGIDVFEIDFNVQRFEMRPDAISQKYADIP